jgi:hypothetical protein
MRIEHTDDRKHDGTQTWARVGGGFLHYKPGRENNCDPYIVARIGTGEWWCEDRKGFVYSFTSLVSGNTDAPKYMTTLARRAKRDLERQQEETTND